MALIVDIVRSVLCSSWLNLLLVFVPVGYVAYIVDINSTLIFIFNALAIVPLSSLLTDVTEKIASDAGDTVGAILNISLGNLVELILFVALKNDQIRVVQASILGSILVNLLLILGSALLTTKLPDQEFLHDAAGTQLLGSLLFVSVFTFLMPTAFDYTFRGTEGAESMSLKMSRISAVMILLIYILYFFHEIKSRTPPHDVEAVPIDEELDDAAGASGQDHVPLRPMPLSSEALNSSQATSRTVRFVDVSPTSEHAPLKEGDRDSLDGLDEEEAGLENEDYLENGEPKEEGGEVIFQASRRVKTRGRSLSLGSSRGALSETSEGGDRTELMAPYLTTRQMLRDSHVNLDRIPTKPKHVSFGPRIDRIVSYVMLIITSSLMSISAEFLASAIDDVIRQGHLSESLIGLIIMPIVGNVAEYATVVIVAARDNMGLALAVSVGSSIQIALCVTPLTVIAGWIMDRPLMLTFNLFEIATLLGSVLLVNFLILGEGVSGPLRSSGLKGGLMCACYIIIGKITTDLLAAFRHSFEPRHMVMRRERDDADDEDIPLHHKRPFGAGLKRKKVEFVRATDADASTTVKATGKQTASIGDVYASIVLGSSSKDSPPNSELTSEEKEDAAAPSERRPEPPTCAVCSLPITTTLQQHEASLAHQVSLEHSHPPSALDRSRMGLRALESQGWDPDSRLGLGRAGEGTRFPIKAILKEDTLGVGATKPAKQEVKEKARPLTTKERRALEEKERRKGERLQAEIYGRVDVEKYLRGNGGEDGL
ncbi:vacuolar calcium ion transporter [Trichoderma arundinaceum]|uniref:Vacuolar calcium ion transporter n=1 Tax=Trichoderma arundinaceum TaxID=490622 RepID=A0A395NR36_TRIAR|nr:vacuolar calcium ion transporter [Trichoderma arundinaceum]